MKLSSTGSAATGIGGEGPGDELESIIQAGSHSMHRADEGAVPSPHHAEPEPAGGQFTSPHMLRAGLLSTNATVSRW